MLLVLYTISDSKQNFIIKKLFKQNVSVNSLCVTVTTSSYKPINSNVSTKILTVSNLSYN